MQDGTVSGWTTLLSQVWSTSLAPATETAGTCIDRIVSFVEAAAEEDRTNTTAGATLVVVGTTPCDGAGVNLGSHLVGFTIEAFNDNTGAPTWRWDGSGRDQVASPECRTVLPLTYRGLRHQWDGGRNNRITALAAAAEDSLPGAEDSLLIFQHAAGVSVHRLDDGRLVCASRLPALRAPGSTSQRSANGGGLVADLDEDGNLDQLEVFVGDRGPLATCFGRKAAGVVALLHNPRMLPLVLATRPLVSTTQACCLWLVCSPGRCCSLRLLGCSHGPAAAGHVCQRYHPFQRLTL